ncbi:MAG: DEAD/DEAH box helicase [Myxococcaceae bacterium]|nr:DEAD/DEAH box helicase [Myxococcaceae bacterium]MCI0672832.1 DEAD/DEAH box helicase [Myxococcaceae bacterium]
MTFNDLKLSEPLLRAVQEEGYSTPTPIQARAIPPALLGRDLLGVAQTGTGKTAAFALPILQRLSQSRPASPGARRPIRALILTPTRELANQIGESFASYGRHTGLNHTVIFGGVGQSAQEKALQRGVDILVATPGRLLDLMQQGFLSYSAVEVFVLDEADRMLDMGFLPDVRRVIKALPQKRQTLFFSATMPPDIQELSQRILVQPERVEVTPVSSTAETVEQRIYHVAQALKRHLLVHLLNDAAMARTLVFTRTKHGANRVAEQLNKAGIPSAAIHGNKSQNARERALGDFKSSAIRVLVATDIAARGIDIDGLSHVVNFELPNVPEQYVHRIGRTGRAGARGIALSFCDGDERAYLKDIERTIRRSVPVVDDHPFRPGAPLPASVRAAEETVVRRAQPPTQQGRGSRPGPQQAQRPGGGSRRQRGGRGGAGRSPSASSGAPMRADVPRASSPPEGGNGAARPAAAGGVPRSRSQRTYSKW